MTAAPSEASITRTYDASLGTLPDAQGFTLYDTGGSPPYTIQGDAMHQGLTSWGQFQWWHSESVPLDFSVGAVMEADVQFMFSSYDTSSGYELTGWHMVISDAATHAFHVQVASDRISLWNQLTFSPVYKPFDTTDGFHHYRLVIADGAGSLFIDGAVEPFLTQPIGPVYYHTPNYVAFGDRTGYGNNESLLRSFFYTNVPEPASLSLLAIGACLALARRKR